jgi:ribosomal protein L25 (general stress protein Ctc)
MKQKRQYQKSPPALAVAYARTTANVPIAVHHSFTRKMMKRKNTTGVSTNDEFILMHLLFSGVQF